MDAKIDAESEAAAAGNRSEGGYNWAGPVIGAVIVGAVAGNVLYARRLKSVLQNASAGAAAARSQHDAVRRHRSFQRVEHLMAARDAKQSAAAAQSRLMDGAVLKAFERSGEDALAALETLKQNYTLPPALTNGDKWEFLGPGASSTASKGQSDGFGGVEGWGTVADPSKALYELRIVTPEVLRALGVLGFARFNVTEAEARLAYNVQVTALEVDKRPPEEEKERAAQLQKVTDAYVYLKEHFYRPDGGAAAAAAAAPAKEEKGSGAGSS